MNRILLPMVITAACVGGSAQALAAKQCDIVGKFTDSLGSKGKFTSQTKGTVDNTAICAKPYALAVTKLTELVIDVKGTSADKSCGALTGKFKFQDGGCTSAAGTVTIAGTGSFADTITRSGKAVHRPAEDTSMLTAGLK